MYQLLNLGVQNNNFGEYELEFVNELDLLLDKIVMDCRVLYFDFNIILLVYVMCYIKGGVYYYFVNIWIDFDRFL